MPLVSTVAIPASPLSPDRSPVLIRVREWGFGPPVVLLHGGWGLDVYPFDDAIRGLSPRYRLIAPDRSGYGGSGDIPDLAADFHAHAAVETLRVLDALELDRVALWGHSDGAVIAVRLAIDAPARVAGIVVEAMHLTGGKPQSREFFARAAAAPASFGSGVAAPLEREHGSRWPHIVARHARAWLRLAERAAAGQRDLYDGRLGAVTAPALLVHGARDPRTEPGELEAIRAALGAASALVLPDAGHSPHSEPATASEVTDAVSRFLETLAFGAGTVFGADTKEETAG